MKHLLFLTLCLTAAASSAQQNSGAQETVAGWIKYEKNPVLGGDFGTIFDISVLREADGYQMWSSWRPKKSIALSLSKDGLKWTDPVPVLGLNLENHLESELNRPCVIKKDKAYHMWYTGQTDGKSWIGYASSPDGKTWTRISKTPVLSAELDWEKTWSMGLFLSGQPIVSW